MKKLSVQFTQITILLLVFSCSDPESARKMKLITLDPGHFHAALVQKSMYADVDPEVAVYSPGGDDLAEHLKK